MYGHEVEVLVAEEGAAYGAALLAGVGAKFWKSVDEACEAVIKVEQRVQPDPSAVKTLTIRYENFRRLYPALKSLFGQIARDA